MYLFLFILLPAALFIYFNTIGEKKLLTLSFTGIITGIVICGIRFIFFTSHRIIPDSFFSNYFFYLINIAILPNIVYGVFFLISKDTIELKLKALFPLMAGFYTIYLPYYFLTLSGSVYSNYDLFLRPVLYLAFLYGLSMAIERLYKAFEEKNNMKKIIYIVMLVLYMIIPAAIDSSYIINKAFPLFAIIGIVYILFPVILFVLGKLGKSKEN
ncbi:MAG: hypothetical protein MJ179_05310 [Treponema sp.]|nr:hypothetical protein [Treponema sp.]